MKRSSHDHKIKISQFKLHLGKYIKEVKAGHEITVLDRESPVAKLVPYSSGSDILVHCTPATTQWDQVKEKWLKVSPAEKSTHLKKGSLEYLTEDRDQK